MGRCDYESIGNMDLKGIEANKNNRIQISRIIQLCTWGKCFP